MILIIFKFFFSYIGFNFLIQNSRWLKKGIYIITGGIKVCVTDMLSYQNNPMLMPPDPDSNSYILAESKLTLSGWEMTGSADVIGRFYKTFNLLKSSGLHIHIAFEKLYIGCINYHTIDWGITVSLIFLPLFAVYLTQLQSKTLVVLF